MSNSSAVFPHTSLSDTPTVRRVARTSDFKHKFQHAMSQKMLFQAVKEDHEEVRSSSRAA